MKRVVAAAFLVSFAMTSVTAFGATSQRFTGKLSSVYVGNNNIAFVYPGTGNWPAASGDPTYDSPACAVHKQRFTYSLDTPHGRAIHASILAAIAQDKNVDLWGSVSCPYTIDGSQAESIKYLGITP